MLRSISPNINCCPHERVREVFAEQFGMAQSAGPLVRFNREVFERLTPALYKPAYIGGRTAAEHRELTEQRAAR